jgi:hypothetical protein
MLARERVLHVSERRVVGDARERSLEARARVGGIDAKRGEPALRFLLETVETTAAWGRELVVHGPSSDAPEVR